MVVKIVVGNTGNHYCKINNQCKGAKIRIMDGKNLRIRNNFRVIE